MTDRVSITGSSRGQRPMFWLRQFLLARLSTKHYRNPPVNDITSHNFGLLIAYLVPGFVALWGATCFSTPLRGLLASTTTELPSISGFLYVTLATVAAGLTVSTVRWLIIDRLHHWTGIRQPDWDFGKLQENILAFEQLIEIHYRYYQFYALWRDLHNAYYADFQIMRSWAGCDG